MAWFRTLGLSIWAVLIILYHFWDQTNALSRQNAKNNNEYLENKKKPKNQNASHHHPPSLFLFCALNVVFDHGGHNFILLSQPFLQKNSGKWQKVHWWFGHFVWEKIAVIWQNCEITGKAQGLIGAAFITLKPHIPGGTTEGKEGGKKKHKLWSRTRRIQAAATSRRCRTALDRWTTTGYWGSCGSAGPPYYTRSPGGSPYPALFWGGRRCVKDNATVG